MKNTQNTQNTNLLPGNEILGCPCAYCSSVRESFEWTKDYPCERFIKSSYLPKLSKIRYTTASERLAEGYTDGEYFIAYSSMRGIICFVKKAEIWGLVYLDSFWNFDAHYMEVDSSTSPAMCLRSFEYELKYLHDTDTPEGAIVDELLGNIKDLYLKALKDEVAYLEKGVL